MRNFFLFIQRYSHFFLLLLLESIAFYFIYSFNTYHHAVILNSSNSANGFVIEKRADITKYFSLGLENERLQLENVALRKLVLESYYIDKGDTITNTDTTFRQKFTYIPGNVIQNSTDLMNNYITIDKGSRHGIKRNMGVIGPQGIVGRIVATSENFSVAMSVLNSKFVATPKLEGNTSSTGKLVWKGESPYFAQIELINKYNVVKKGSTIRTSNYSPDFPENILIGKVAEVKPDNGGSFLKIKVRLSTNFTNLRSVYIINNLQKTELESLESQLSNGN